MNALVNIGLSRFCAVITVKQQRSYSLSIFIAWHLYVFARFHDNYRVMLSLVRPMVPHRCMAAAVIVRHRSQLVAVSLTCSSSVLLSSLSSVNLPNLVVVFPHFCSSLVFWSRLFSASFTFILTIVWLSPSHPTLLCCQLNKPQLQLILLYI